MPPQWTGNLHDVVGAGEALGVSLEKVAKNKILNEAAETAKSSVNNQRTFPLKKPFHVKIYNIFTKPVTGNPSY